MNLESPRQKAQITATVVAVLGTLLVVGGLVALMRHYTATPSLAEDRSAERMKILAEFKAANSPLLEKYDWQDQPKGIIRVPVARAKELVLEEWQNPGSAHSNLISRAAKAFALPPKQPEKKSEFE